MDLENYTADAVCRAMGLSGFVESDWAGSTLRLLLMPPFQPEVCLTLFAAAGADRISVVGLTQMLWRQNYPCRVHEIHEEATISPADFDRMREGFATSLASNRGGAFPDGMAVESCFYSGGKVERFGDYVYQPPLCLFVARS